jgi:hypothetical protein
VAHVGRVRGHEELHPGARRPDEREVERAGDDEGGDPLVEVVKAADEAGEHATKGQSTGITGFFLLDLTWK